VPNIGDSTKTNPGVLSSSSINGETNVRAVGTEEPDGLHQVADRLSQDALSKLDQMEATRDIPVLHALTSEPEH